MKESLQDALRDQRNTPTGEPFAVEGRGAERVRVGGVVEHRERFGGDGLADTVPEGRAALHHQLAREHAGDDAEDRCGEPGLEYHQWSAGGGVRRPEDEHLAPLRVGRPPRCRATGAPPRRRPHSRCEEPSRSSMSGCVPIDADAPRSQPSIPAVETMALSPRESAYIEVRTPRTRGSAPRVAASSATAIATLSSTEVASMRSSHGSMSAAPTPSGSASPTRSSAPRTTCCRGPRQGACRSRRGPTSLRGRVLHARHGSLGHRHRGPATVSDSTSPS